MSVFNPPFINGRINIIISDEVEEMKEEKEEVERGCMAWQGLLNCRHKLNAV